MLVFILAVFNSKTSTMLYVVFGGFSIHYHIAKTFIFPQVIADCSSGPPGVTPLSGSPLQAAGSRAAARFLLLGAGC